MVNQMTDNLMEGKNQVEAAEEQLYQASLAQKKAKKKYIIFLIIIVLVVIIVAGIVYFQLT